MDTLSLRPATLDDLPAVLAIERASYPNPWTEDHFRAEMEKPHSRFLVLTDDETDTIVAGYIVYWVLMEEGQILNVAVAPDFRGRGIGKTLVRQAIKDGLKEGAKRMLLDVRKGNEAAIQLYQGIGFAVTRLHKGFYSNGDDAYQMTLDLTDESIRF